MTAGITFQSFGAADLNALPPRVVKHFPVGGNSVKLPHDLKLYVVCLLMLIRSIKYFGASPCMHLKVNNKNFKLNPVNNRQPV